jgi:hypothetical protein
MMLVDANEQQAVFEFAGGETPVAWDTISPKRLAGMASKYAASGGDHFDIARYAAACGEGRSAAKAIERAREAGLDGEETQMARALETVIQAE